MIAGLDFSTKCVDVVLLDDEGARAEWQRYPLRVKAGAFEAARSVRTACPTLGWWRDSPAIMAGIERPYSRGFAAASALLRIQGAILSTIPETLPLLELTAQEWKRELVGATNASKDDVARAVVRLFAPAALWPQDAFDAYGVAWALRALCERGEAAA